MPLIRPDETLALKSAFSRFCVSLEGCIRRDGTIDNSGYFSSDRSVNNMAGGSYGLIMSLTSTFRDILVRPRDTGGTNFLSSVNEERLRNAVDGRNFVPLIRTLKETILCAFEMTNRGQTKKINKQQLYAFLFCLGLPAGLIAKIILNGELAPIKNAIRKYNRLCKDLLTQIALGQRRDNINGGFFANENLGSAIEDRLFMFACLSKAVGGMGLYRKFINQEDQLDLLFTDRSGLENREDYERFKKQYIKNILLVTNEDLYNRFYENLKYIFALTFVGERGVRRTGQTLSRNATTTRRENIVILERETPSAPTPVETTILSTPNDAGRSQSPTPRQAREKVRDIPLTTTFGIEIEGSFMQGVDSVGDTNAQWNKLKSVLREADFDCDIVNSRGQITGVGKLGVRQERTQQDMESYWKYKYDGSVHGGSPYEFASPILKGKNGVEQVKLICSAMRQAGFYSNATAGVHVHLGAKDLELDTFKNVCYNFTKFEPLIDMMLPADRRWSNAFFSESFSKYSNFESLLNSATTFDRLVDVLMRGERYYAVNLQAYYRFGTIEFRKLIGTNDDRLIIWYLYYLHYLLEASKRKRLTNFTLKGLQDILPAWSYAFFVDRVRQVSGYDIKYGFDVGARGSSGTQTNTFSRGGDPMQSPFQTYRGKNKNRDNNDFS